MPLCPLGAGVELYYETHGSGPPLVLVPGLGGVGAFWARHLPALTPHFTVVMYDHRGCGRSSHDRRTPYSIEQMAADVLALMDHLKLDRVHYIGHSTGGAIGQVLALDHPQRIDRLFLSATWSHGDAYFRQLFECRLTLLEKAGVEAYNRLGALFFYSPDYFRTHAATLEATQAASTIPATPAEITASRIRALLAYDRAASLPRIRHRTLVACARDDVVTPAYFSQEIAAAIPDARLHLLPSGGHFYNHVRPREFERLALDFFTAD